MKVKFKETFEYVIEFPDDYNDTQIRKNLWCIEDTVDCVNDMPCPFWDGFPQPKSMEVTLDYEKL